MSLAGLLELANGGGSPGESCASRDGWHDGSRAPRSPDEGGAQHDGGGLSGDWRKWKRKGGDSRRGTCSCQWVGGGDGWWSAQGAIRENEVAGGCQGDHHGPVA